MHLNTFTCIHGEHKINSPIVAEIASVLSRDHSILKKERIKREIQSILNEERFFRNISSSSYIFKALCTFLLIDKLFGSRKAF